jgi:hypothetical protein
VDKLSKAAARGRSSEIARDLALGADQVIPFSSQTGEGRAELLEAIVDLVVETDAGDDSR